VVEKGSRKIICVDVDKGKKHDFRLFKESKLPILSSTEIQADIGYQGIQKNMPIAKSHIKVKRKHH